MYILIMNIGDKNNVCMYAEGMNKEIDVTEYGREDATNNNVRIILYISKREN